MKHNRDANNMPALMICFGLFFALAGAGLIVLTQVKNSLETWILVVGIIFAVVGVYLLVFGIYRAVVLKKYKALVADPNAFVTDATFVKSRYSSYSGAGIGTDRIFVPTRIDVFKKVFYEYTDQNGEKHTVKSVLSYIPMQAKYLKDKGTFKVKCNGKRSAIIEELPQSKERYNI